MKQIDHSFFGLLVGRMVLFIALSISSLTISEISYGAPKPERLNEFILLMEEEPALTGERSTIRSAQSFSARTTAAGAAQIQTYVERLEASQNRVEQRARRIDPGFSVERRFTHLINALSVSISPERVKEIEEIPGVKRVAPMGYSKMLLPVSNDLMRSHLAWERLGGEFSAGEGVLIAVIDTGIDITHPAFDDKGYTSPPGFPKGDSAFTNNKVIVSRVFPGRQGGDNSHFDRDGHGVNVASIAAANPVRSPLGFLAGVAPKAYVGSYKVFTSDTASDAQIIAAIEQAVLDGADIINLSLGSEEYVDPQHSPPIIAIRNAIELGVVVTIASGNSARPLTIGMPAQIEEALTVGAVTNAHRSTGQPNSLNKDLWLTVWVDGDPVMEQTPTTFGTSGGPYTQPILGRFPIVDADVLEGGSYGGVQDGLACSPFDVEAPLNAWVLVQRGDCEFVTKTNHVLQAGGTGVLFYDTPSGPSLAVENPPISPLAQGNTIPSMLTLRDAGLLIKDMLQLGANVEIELRGPDISANTAEPNLLANFNSSGPTVNHVLKPDVVAVGSNSFGATQNDIDVNSFVAGGFKWFSGTSMSSPRGAGVAALVRQANPSWPPAWIKSAIVTTSRQPVLRSNNRNEATPVERGAGMIDAEAAILTDAIIDPPLLGLGVYAPTQPSVETRWLTITNVSGQTNQFKMRALQPESSLQPSLSNESFALNDNESIEIEVSIPIGSNLPEGDHEQVLLLENISTGRSNTVVIWARIEQAPPVTANVLLLDGDRGASRGEEFEQFYFDRLDELGVAYDHWPIMNWGERYPTLDYMKNYDTVIWFMGGTSLNHYTDRSSRAYLDAANKRHFFENDLTRYLDLGGSLLLTGMDFLDVRENSAITHEVLGARLAIHDHGARTVAGLSDNPVGSEIGEIQVRNLFNLDDYTDVIRPLAGRGAQAAFYANGNSNRTVGLTIDQCNYRAVFLAFPLEALEPSGAAAILSNSLEWLSERTASPSALFSITPSSIDLNTDIGDIEVTIHGSGFTFSDGYSARVGAQPILDLRREDCARLVGRIDVSALRPGQYSLHALHGNGRKLRLGNALTVVGDDTPVTQWDLHARIDD